jgi:hypothetical protein
MIVDILQKKHLTILSLGISRTPKKFSFKPFKKNINGKVSFFMNTFFKICAIFKSKYNI